MWGLTPILLGAEGQHSPVARIQISAAVIRFNVVKLQCTIISTWTPPYSTSALLGSFGVQYEAGWAGGTAQPNAEGLEDLTFCEEGYSGST